MRVFAGGARFTGILLALIGIFAVAYACGDDDGGNGAPGSATPFTDTGGGADVNTEKFTVSMIDNVFDPTAINVAGGVVASIDIRNNGKQIHNMRVAGEDNVYNNQDDAVSEPALVNDAEAATLNWAAPAAGGVFDFRCDFHPATMVGKITVTKTEDTSGGGQEGP